jgi:hypothetical protein
MHVMILTYLGDDRATSTNNLWMKLWVNSDLEFEVSQFLTDHRIQCMISNTWHDPVMNVQGKVIEWSAEKRTRRPERGTILKESLQKRKLTGDSHNSSVPNVLDLRKQ